MKIYRLILLILTWLTGGVMSASVPVITGIDHIQTRNGLSSEKIFSIIEDRDGVIWMGTKAGVDRFNGREFRHYPLHDEFYYGDFAARVTKLLINQDDELVAYDNTGRLYWFNRVADRFEVKLRLNDRFKEYITLNTVVPGADGSLLLGLTSGLFRYDREKVSEVVGGVSVNDIKVLDGGVLVASTGGTFLLSSGTREKKVISDENTQTIFYEEGAPWVYIGTFNNGFWRCNTMTGQTEKLNQANKGFEKPVRAIKRLDDRYIAIGIDGAGVYVLDTEDQGIEKLVDAGDRTGIHLNGNGVYSLLTDSYGNLWAGSYTGGITIVMFNSWPARHIVHDKGNPNSISNNNVNAIAENSDGKIWFATDAGISIENPSTGMWSHIDMKAVIVALQRLGNGRIAAGTYGDGIYIFDPSGKELRHITRGNSEISSNYIFSIRQDTGGDIWAASLDGGIMRFDREFNYKKTYPVDVAFNITVTPSGKIAAATADGYYVIDPETEKTEHYAGFAEQSNSNSSVYIISMLFSEDGHVWLGTEGGGINVYDPATRTIVRKYRTENGLPSNDVYCLLKDNDGNIVASTGNGIAILQDSVFRSMNYLHGCAKEYNKSAGALLGNGDMIFGSVYGAVRLTPSKARGADYTAKLRITGFAVDGREEDIDYLESLKRELDDRRISLAYADNTFRVSFESINLPYQEDIGYQYILENYDKGWSDVSESGTAVYKQVMPGDYTLHIRSVRISDGTVLDEKDVEISVGRPWWAQWWAICGYIAVIVLLGYFVYIYKRNKLKQNYDEDKIRFFINTAHDIKPPVSLVMGPISDLQNDESITGKSRELVSIAGSNIRKLNSIMTQLLEFERFERGNRGPKRETIDMTEFVAMEVDCFRNAFKRKGIDVAFRKPEEPVCMSGDRYLLEMMIDNLLSNACKYTMNGGTVTVSLEPCNKKFRLSVGDNGIGIPRKDQKKIFVNVHRAQNARESNESGTGFGLLQVRRIVEIHGGDIQLRSIEGQGTVFTLTFDRIFLSAPASQAEKLTVAYLDELGSFEPYSNIVSSGKSSTILIVEDNDDLRNYLCKTFSTDYDIAATSSADDAMAYLEDHYPDLIISDVMMAGMQGDDFCLAVKSNPQTAGIPFILLTAKAGHEAMVEGLTKGADDYIPKPFNTEILKVAGMLANRERMREFLIRRSVEQVTAREESVPAEESGEKPVSEADKAFIDKVTDIIVRNLREQEFNIDRLCREMAMSRTLFYGRLKSLTGKAPQEFIRLIRLEHAAELLRQGCQVADASDASGFVNVKYFMTLFKKHYGVTPGKYAGTASAPASEDSSENQLSLSAKPVNE